MSNCEIHGKDELGHCDPCSLSLTVRHWRTSQTDAGDENDNVTGVERQRLEACRYMPAWSEQRSSAA
jgi:hypothetical protein